MRGVGGAALAAGVVVALSACQAADPSPAPTTAAAAAPQAGLTVPAPVPTSAGVEPNFDVEHDDPEPQPLPSPTPDATSDASAIEGATQAMTVFARREVPQAQWWSDLAPHLSDAAREAYGGTDPANVPASAVTGAATLVASDSGYLATVAVPTDAGVYEVLLSRAGQYAPWSVEQLTPPEGLN